MVMVEGKKSPTPCRKGGGRGVGGGGGGGGG